MRLVLAAVALLSGCKPQIGDACTSAVECSTLGDRLCDITQPDGYCTQFGCQPDGCPTEAACIVFRSTIDPSCGTVLDGKYGRFSQSFCMLACVESADCRAGYECALPTTHDARLLDVKRTDPATFKVCLAVATVVPSPAEPPGICSPSTAPPLIPTTASAGAGGMDGGGGMGTGGN